MQLVFSIIILITLKLIIGVEAAGLGVSTDKSAATTKLGKKEFYMEVKHY